MRPVHLLLLALLWVPLSSCTPAQTVFQRQFFAFGTLVDLTLVAPDQALANASFEAIESLFQEYHQRWHPWKPGLLASVNHSLSLGETVTPAAELRALLDRALPLARQSGYRFDPGIGSLIALWGFHSDTQPNGPPPSPQQRKKWLSQSPSIADLQWKQNQLSSSNPMVQLDFGGFAKGYAVDAAIFRLREMGIQNAIINAGGDLRAIGRRPQRPWRIGIRHPRNNQVLAWVDIDGDESVFTSGDYERFYLHQERRYHHILDPHQGEPAQGTTSVTVIHSDATTADAAATALFIAGPEHWQEVARNMGITYALLIDAAGEAHLTAAMQTKIHFEQTPSKLHLGGPLP